MRSVESAQKRKKRTKAQKAHKYPGTRLNILGCTVKPLFFRPKRKKRTKAQKAHKRPLLNGRTKKQIFEFKFEILKRM